jgi:hypothetical protein
MRWTWPLLLLAPSLAWGHAGVPFGRQPFVQDGELVMGGGTTGFVWIEDGVPRWTCEDAFFLQPTFWHPAASGRLLAGTVYGLRASDDLGCSWHDVVKLRDDAFLDLEVDPLDPAHLWLVAGHPGGTQRVYESWDDGLRWSVGLELEGVDLRQIEASDDGGTLFLVGRQRAERDGMIWRSEDGGVHWSDPRVLQGWEAVGLLDVSEDAQRLHLSAVAGEGGFWLLEQDAALAAPPVPIADWYSPPTAAAEVGGVLFLAVGAERLEARQPDGTWAEIPGVPPSCLERIDGVLWACSYPPNHPQYLYSDDLGATWISALDFSDVERRQCPPGTAAEEVCPEVWERIQSLQIQLGDDDDDDATPDDDDTSIFFDDDDSAAAAPPPACGGCVTPGPGGGPWLVLLALCRRRSR